MALSDRNNSRNLARSAHMIGSITFIAIGTLHTITQFTTLSSERVKAAYRAGGPIEVSGQVVDGWDLFAGTSVLMGVYAIAIGAFNLAALSTTTRPDRLAPPIVLAITLGVLWVILAVGATLLGPLQFFGGIAGLVLFGLPLVDALRHSPEPTAH